MIKDKELQDEPLPRVEDYFTACQDAGIDPYDPRKAIGLDPKGNPIVRNPQGRIGALQRLEAALEDIRKKGLLR